MAYGKPRYKLMSRDTIQAATKGEPDAVAAVLRHYEGYIAKLYLHFVPTPPEGTHAGC